MKLNHIFQTHLFRNCGIILSGFVLATPAFAQTYSAFDIGTLSGGGTYATAINASGQVTGNSSTKDGPYHAFVTKADGVGMSDLGTLPGGFNSYGFGINASGQVTGVSDYLEYPGVPGVSTSPHAFVANPNGDMNLVTSWSYSEGHGINDSAQIAGFSVISNSNGGVFVTSANGLNPRGIGQFALV